MDLQQFSERPASTTWEIIPLVDAPSRVIWAWYRPPAAHSGVFIQIPEETFRDAAAGPPLTSRTLAWSIGFDPATVAYWSLYGHSFDGAQGTNPAWDHLLTDPGPISDRTIAFFLAVPVIEPQIAVPEFDSGIVGGVDLFQRMESDWQASVQLENQLASAALQLKGTFGRVNSLNRDLTSEEFRYADQRDKQEWQDARRWLRDVADRVQRFLKDYQTGDTSIAGKRNHYAYLFDTYVVPRRPFAGLEQAAREFESHRKNLQTLLSNMSMAQNAASQDGERRAQQILSRMASRVRSSRSKR